MSNQRTVVRLTGNFLITIMDDRKQWNDIFDVPKEYYCQLKTLYPERIYISKMMEKQRHLKQADAETDCHDKTLTTGISQNVLQTEEKIILEGRSKIQEYINNKEHGKYWANKNQY